MFPFLQSSLHLCSLHHCLHPIIPFPNRPSLPKIMTNIRRNRTEILEGHSETLQTLRVRLLVFKLSVLWEAAVSFYPMSNVLWAKWKAESDLQIHLLSKVLLEDLEAEQVQLDCSPLGTSSSPTSVGSVRSPGSSSANTGTPGTRIQSQHEVLQSFFQSLLTTNTRDRTANAAAASRSSADLRTSEEQLTTIEGDDKLDK